MRIESVKVDNGSVTVRKVYKEGRGSVKICKGFVKGKGVSSKGCNKSKGSVKVYIRVYNFLVKTVLRLK